MKLISFDGWTFSADGYTASPPMSARAGQWTTTPQIQPRLNTYGVLSGSQLTPRTMPVEFFWSIGADIETPVDNLIARLQPDNTDARLLVAQRGDGTFIQTYATVQLAGMVDDTLNSLPVVFTAVDPLWRKQTPTVYGPSSWGYAGGNMLGTPNLGKARANLSLVLKPTAYDPGTVGFKYRRQFTLTNNSDTPFRQFPYEVDLGNSNGWGNTVTANFAKTWVFRDGLAVPRELIGWSEIQSYMWILIDDLAPGASATYDIAWEGLNDAPGLTGNRRPAFDISWEKNNASAGSASTITKSSATWRTDQWARGKVHILSGAGAGQNRYILSNTATVITLVSTWTTNPDATSVFLLTMSHNDRWIYDVRQTSRSNPNRGLWYQNKGQTKPSTVVFDTPGAWYRTLTLDNNDEKNQSRTFAIDVGGGDIDYFNGLDADRTVQGWTRLQESGQADGVAFSSPIEIDGFRFDVAFKNPNAVGRAHVGYRESGSEDWEEAYNDATASNTLIASAVQDITFVSDIRHLAAYLSPFDDAVMPTAIIRDTGSRTGGGSSTLLDDSKEWPTNIWTNGYVRITAGTGAGQSRTVTSNSSVALGVSPNFTTIPSDDSRFEVRNKKLVATLRHNTIWEVRLNTGKVSQSAIGAQITNYSLIPEFHLGGGLTSTLPYQRVQIGSGARVAFVASTEELRIDGARRRAGVYLTSSGGFLRDVTNAVLVMDRTETGATALAPEWLVVAPNPTNPLTNPAFTGNITGWALSGVTAGVTRTGTYDAAVFHTAAGAFMVQITASTAGVGAAVQYATPTAAPFIPVTPGQQLTVTAWGRTLSGNWRPTISLVWYDAAAVLIAASTNLTFATTPLTATWYEIGHMATAPSTAASVRVVLYSHQYVATSTDSVWFDDVVWNTSALWEGAQSSGVTMNITASLTEGYYG